MYIFEIFGLETTMKGRFLRLSIRCARRIGRRERVKLADEKRASVDSGGRPCLEKCKQVTTAIFK